MVRFMLYYPWRQVPDMLKVLAAGMTYRNVSIWDLFGYDWSGFQFVFTHGSGFAQDQVGGSSGKFVGDVGPIYFILR